MKKYSFLLILALVVVSGFATATADTMVLRPTSVANLKSGNAEPVSAAAFTFDLSQLPAGARIDLAELLMRLDTETSSTDAIRVSFGLATSDWTAATPTLSDQVPTSDSLFVTALVEPGHDRSVEVDLSEIVTLWLHAAIPNHGIVVSLNGDGSQRPQLSSVIPSESMTLTVYYTNVSRSE